MDRSRAQSPSVSPISLRIPSSISQAFPKLLERASRSFRQGLAMQKRVGHSVVSRRAAPRTWHRVKRKGARRPERSFGLRSATRDREAAQPSSNMARNGVVIEYRSGERKKALGGNESTQTESAHDRNRSKSSEMVINRDFRVTTLIPRARIARPLAAAMLSRKRRQIWSSPISTRNIANRLGLSSAQLINVLAFRLHKISRKYNRWQPDKRYFCVIANKITETRSSKQTTRTRNINDSISKIVSPRVWKIIFQLYGKSGDVSFRRTASNITSCPVQSRSNARKTTTINELPN